MQALYADLPRDVLGLHAHFKDPAAVDSDSFFTRVGDEVRFKEGKHRGLPPVSVAVQHPDYLRWILDADFGPDTKAVVRGAMG